MQFRASEIARAVHGELFGRDDTVDGVTIDSRTVRGGELFVPIRAERDGHDFIPQAVAAGATVYLTEQLPGPGTAIRVPDTAAALLALGHAARRKLPDRVVGITGSVGKTSTKDLLAAVLATTWPTTASERSFNNELGVPLTLCNAPDDTAAAVVEMGARGFEHIRLLCGVARPTAAIVTAVADAHLELFGSLDAVATAKAELVEALPGNGVAVLNGDDERVAAMAGRTTAHVVTYSLEHPHGGTVTATDLVLDDELRPSFRLHSPWGGADVRLQVRGRHQAANALGSAACALALGVSIDDVVLGLDGARLSAMRMHLVRLASGAVVVNDAYNANPTSTRAGLDALAELPADRRVAVLGIMAELGDGGPAGHRSVADHAADLGIHLISVGAADYGTAGAAAASDIDGALAALGPLGPGDAVLVKGSRVAGLEALVDRLVATHGLAEG